MADSDDVTLGEVHRICERILEQAQLTNGRLRSAEATIATHSWALGAMGSALLVWLGVWLAKVL